MSEQNNGNQPINDADLEEMRREVRALIVRFCKPKVLGKRQKLYLHDDEVIEFTKHEPDEIEMF